MSSNFITCYRCGHNPDRLNDTHLGVRYLIFVYFLFFIYLSEYLNEERSAHCLDFFMLKRALLAIYSAGGLIDNRELLIS
jgi:hypothetical protein